MASQLRRLRNTPQTTPVKKKDVGHSIASLMELGSPVKAKRKQPSSTSASPRKRKATLNVENEEKPSAPAAVQAQDAAEAPQETEEKILLKLFDGMEAVLRYTASRRRHTPRKALNENLEAHTGRGLTTERLEKVLSLAEGMFEVSWIGTGARAFLAVEQRDEEGKPRAPTAEEVVLRKAKFEEALTEAKEKFARRPLPVHPDSKSVEAVAQDDTALSQADICKAAAAAAALKARASLPPLAREGSSETRMEALRARICAKKVYLAREAVQDAKLKKLDAAISACEDAIAAHAVLAQLFARGGLTAGAATETELLGAVCSVSYGMQCKRPLSPEAGKAAVAHLKQQGEGMWFAIEEAVLSTTAGCYLRKLPGGSQVATRDSLEKELRRLNQELRELMTKGAHSEVEAAPPSSSAGPEPGPVADIRVSADDRARTEVGGEVEESAASKKNVAAEAKAKAKAKAKAEVKTETKVKAKAKAKAEAKAETKAKAKAASEPKKRGGRKHR